jgi:integrase
LKVSIYPRGHKLYIRISNGSAKPERIATGYDNNPEGWRLAEIIVQKERLNILEQNDRALHNRFTLDEAFKVFIEHRKKVCTRYEKYIKVNMEFSRFTHNAEITDITEDNCLDFKNSLLKKLAHNTVSGYLNHLRIIFNFYYKKKKWISENPVPSLKLELSPFNIIPREHLKKIFKYYKNKPGRIDYFKFLYLSGFRSQEAAAVRRKDLFFDRKMVQVGNTKGKRIELFPMIRGLDTFLQQYKGLKPDERLFKVNPPAISVEFSKICVDKIKLPPYTMHDFRRTFGTEMAKLIMPPQLMKLMRHIDIRTTMKYYIEIDLNELNRKNFKPSLKI